MKINIFIMLMISLLICSASILIASGYSDQASQKKIVHHNQKTTNSAQSIAAAVAAGTRAAAIATIITDSITKTNQTKGCKNSVSGSRSEGE
jgi:archaellum biogenesis protein FlaJ (TadC family)